MGESDVRRRKRVELAESARKRTPAQRLRRIAMKLEADGGHDLEDVRRLLEIRGDALDQPMLREACTARGVLERLANLRR